MSFSPGEKPRDAQNVKIKTLHDFAGYNIVGNIFVNRSNYFCIVHLFRTCRINDAHNVLASIFDTIHCFDCDKRLTSDGAIGTRSMISRLLTEKDINTGARSSNRQCLSTRSINSV